MKPYNTYENQKIETITTCIPSGRKKIIVRLSIVGLILSVCILFDNGFSSAYASIGEYTVYCTDGNIAKGDS